MTFFQYIWSYSFIRVMAYLLMAGVVGVVVFLVGSSLIVRKRLKRKGSGALTIDDLNRLLQTSEKKGGTA